MLAIDYGRPFKAVVLDLAQSSPKGGPETVRQFAVIFALQDAKSDVDRTVRALATTLKVGKPAITRAVDTLVRENVVRRRRDPKDGRNVFVDLLAEVEDSTARSAATSEPTHATM